MEDGAAAMEAAPPTATAPDLAPGSVAATGTSVPPALETALDGVSATALEDSLSQGLGLSQVGHVDASQAAWLEGELASGFAGGEPDSGAALCSQGEATRRIRAQPVASPARARSQDDLEGDLERVMEDGLSQNFIENARFAAEAMSQDVLDASQQSMPGSLELDLERIMEGGVSQSLSQL